MPSDIEKGAKIVRTNGGGTQVLPQTPSKAQMPPQMSSKTRKGEHMSIPRYRDFLSAESLREELTQEERDAATQNRATQTITKNVIIAKNEVEKPAVQELEELVAQRIHANPAMTREIVVGQIFSQRPELL
jgi:hypothetical protein